jgi:ribonuclease VapC
MIIDTSALVAILDQEPEAERIAHTLAATPERMLSAAFRHYGRGRHDAKLNLGDCFAYALAKDQSAPQLFKGNDFSQTDVIVARY